MSETEKKIGMTFTQIIAMLGILASIFLAYQSMAVRMTAVEIRVNKLEENVIQTRQDYKTINDKLDKLILREL